MDASVEDGRGVVVGGGGGDGRQGRVKATAAELVPPWPE